MPDTNQKINTAEKFYSYHIFLFPFKWSDKLFKEDILENQTKVEDWTKVISGYTNWQSKDDWNTFNTLVSHNEAKYFYEFVRKTLYDLPEDNDVFLKHFSYQLQEASWYCITVSGRTYRLKIDSILLHVYNTGVGTLSYHLVNEEQSQSSPQDILNINQYGRRIFPPFYGTDQHLFGTREFFRDNNWNLGLDGVKNKELAESIHLESDNGWWVEESFISGYEKPCLEPLPAFISKLFPKSILERYLIEPVLDDRMFVVCWYGNKELADYLGKEHKHHTDKEPVLNYQDDDWWFKYLQVDAGMKTCQDKQMTRDIIRKHTNPRWSGYSTFYGVTRYSFVMLTGQISSLGSAFFLISHLQTMYFKLVELCLIQRACLLRFSDEVAAISALDDNKRLHSRVSSLYKQYIRFVNRIYFREVTAQEQGIELYDILQNAMRMERNVKDLDGEIQELYQYVNLNEEDQRNKTIENLSLVGALFLIPTFTVGFLGVNLESKYMPYLLVACLSIAIMTWFTFKASDNKHKITLGISLIVILLTALYVLSKFM
jgi:hypothetical protein